jgi:hypothetical protein
MDIEQEASTLVSTTTVTQVAEKASSWFDSLKRLFKIDTIEWTPQTIMYIGIFAAGGFLCAFFLKKYSSYVFVLLLAGAGLIALSYAGVVSVVVSTARLHELLGIPQEFLHANMIIILWAWAKEHLLYVACAAIGFFVGLKVA